MNSWHRGPGARDLECATCEAVFPVGGDCLCPKEPSFVERMQERTPLLRQPIDAAGYSADEIRVKIAELIDQSRAVGERLHTAKNARDRGIAQSEVKLIEFRRRLLMSAYEAARDRELVDQIDRLKRIADTSKPRVQSRRKMRKSDIDALLKPRPEAKPEEN